MDHAVRRAAATDSMVRPTHHATASRRLSEHSRRSVPDSVTVKAGVKVWVFPRPQAAAVSADSMRFWPSTFSARTRGSGWIANHSSASILNSNKSCVNTFVTKTRCGKASLGRQRPPPVPALGSLWGNYQLLEVLGQGGMGVVYKAHQKSLDRIVAVKMIRALRRGDGEEVQRFYAEAEAAAQLQHPNIVRIYEVHKAGDQPFFSMDLVEGQSLAKMIAEKPLPQRQAARYVQKMAVAMQYAHQRGVVHRDLKPANVLIDQDDEPRITDFGLAKRVECDSKLTATGFPMGTPSYMPPEQARGAWSEVGAQSDVYALGATLYDLLAGRPPFSAATWSELLIQVLNHEPLSPRDLNPALHRDLETICLKCLQKRPGDRYGSAQELADDLARHLRGESIHARPISPVERTWRWCCRYPWAVAAMTALAVGFCLALVGYRHAVRGERVAVQALVQAKEAVDRFYSVTSEHTLLNRPGMKRLRQELLKMAEPFYRELHEQSRTYRQASLLLGSDQALTTYRLARITGDLGEEDQAYQLFAEACAQFQELDLAYRNYPKTDRGWQQMLEAYGTAMNDFAILLDRRARRATAGNPRDSAIAESRQYYESAKRLRAELVKVRPDKCVLLANTLMNLGSLAEQLARESDPRAERETLAASAGAERPWSRAMEAMYEAQLLRLGLPTDAPVAVKQERYLEALRERRNLPSGQQLGQSEDPQLQHDLAQGDYNLARLHWELHLALRQQAESRDENAWEENALSELRDRAEQEVTAGEDLIDTAIQRFESLLAGRDQIRSFDCIDADFDLAVAQRLTGDISCAPEKVTDSYAKAAGRLEHLAVQNPDTPDFQLELARTYFNLSQLDVRDRLLQPEIDRSDLPFPCPRKHDADALWESVEKIFERLKQIDPEHGKDYQQEFGKLKALRELPAAPPPVAPPPRDLRRAAEGQSSAKNVERCGRSARSGCHG